MEWCEDSRKITDRLYDYVIGLDYVFITDNINTKEYAKSVDAKTLIITSDSDTTIKSSIPYSLADYFSNANVKEFKGIEHEGYWSDKDVVSTVISFCK